MVEFHKLNNFEIPIYISGIGLYKLSNIEVNIRM